MTESTKNRIVDDYWWKGMTRDIDEYISRCMTCQRHENFTPIEHPAKALRVGKPFEIVPIMSKEAEEVARCYWLYVCQFGPPKVMLTDKGTEFTNNIVRNLLNLTGTDHRVTSAYNPRVNGMCERGRTRLLYNH